MTPSLENEDDIIHAAAYLLTPAEKKALTKRHGKKARELIYDESYDGVVLRIFGDLPSYNQPEFEALWEEVLVKDPEEIYDYCLLKGIDLFGADGVPVPPWRDIAVMLMAIERGILEIL